jgi:hypothetical protein
MVRSGMSEDGLRAELGADPPPGLIAQLDEAALEELAFAVRTAKARQREALDRAEDGALRHLPRLVRRALRTVLR